MVKIIIALALLVALVAGQINTGIGNVCRPQGCVATGAVCDTPTNTNLTVSTRERWCKGSDFCRYEGMNITGICVDRADVGEACNEDDGSKLCEEGLSCVNKFCNRGYLPGAKCKEANDCLYYTENGDDTAVCNNGRCAGIAAGAKCSNLLQSCLPPNVCGTDGNCVAAVGAGSACRANQHCQIGTYCKAGTCTARIGAGGACDVLARNALSYIDEQCILKYTCIPNAQSGDNALNGTCKEMFSATAGAVCRATTDCTGGLTCLPAPQGSTYGACGPVVSSSRRSCNATRGADLNGVCSANEYCLCNSNTGAGSCFSSNAEIANKGGKKALSSAAGCVEKCSRTDWNCLEKCGGKICSFRSKLGSSNEKTDNFYTQCKDDDDVKDVVHAGYVMCSSGSLVQFSVIGLVAFVAALLF